MLMMHKKIHVVLIEQPENKAELKKNYLCISVFIIYYWITYT